MNFEGYFSIPFGDDFHNRPLWIPETPHKSTAITTQNSGVDLGGLHGCAHVEPSSMNLCINGGNSSIWPQKDGTINQIADSYGHSIFNSGPGMSAIRFTDLLTEGIAESDRSICMMDEVSVPCLYYHVDDRCHFSSPLGSFLGNEDLCSGTIPPNCIDKWPQYEPSGLDEFAASDMFSCNKNATTFREYQAASSPTDLPKSDLTEADQMKSSENKKLQEVLRLIFEDPVQDEAHVSSLKIQDIEKHCDALLYRCIHPPSLSVSSFLEENQHSNKVRDLNATPVKKPPKRRKHRPKVVIEGKPQRRSSKSESQKVDNLKEKRVGKRKYVRNNVPHGNEKITDSKRKTCRRVLHFGTEISENGSLIKATDQNECFKELGSPLLKLGSYIEADNQQQESFLTRWNQACLNPDFDINSVPGKNLDAQICHHECSVVTENGETYSNCCQNQVPVPGVIELISEQARNIYHQNQQTDTPRDTNLKGVGQTDVKNLGNSVSIGQTVVQAQTSLINNENSVNSLPKSSPKSMRKVCAYKNQKKESKRHYASIVPEHLYSHTMSSSVCQISNRCSSPGDHDTHGQKKQKVVSDVQGSSNIYFSSAEGHHSHGGRHSITDDGFGSQPNTIKSAHSSENNLVHKKCSDGVSESISNWLFKSVSSDLYFGGGQCFSSDPNPHIRKTDTKKSNIFTIFPDMVMTGDKLNPLTAMSVTSSSTRHAQSRADIGHGNVLAKTRAMKVTVQSKEMVPFSVNSGCNSLRKMSGDAAALDWFPNKIHRSNNVSGKRLSHKQKHMDIVEEIVCKLRFLTISDKSSGALMCLQNSIIPYEVGGKIVPYRVGGMIDSYEVGGKIVPYEGVYQIKKRKPRPRVDLDPETDRLWNLLMGKNGSEEGAGAYGDKERYWEEEREVFRGRADSFIARMHLVQGDRRFSQWKGSVVDSVIGVFLTQNVSDHLSSSAFMSLAARFPLRSSKNMAYYRGDTDMAYYRGDTDLPVVPEILDLVEPVCNYKGIVDSVAQNEHQELTNLEVSWCLPSCDQIIREAISSQDSLVTLSAKATEEAISSSGSNSVVSNSEADDSATPIHDSLDHRNQNVTQNSDFERRKTPFYCKLSFHRNLPEHTKNWQNRNPEGGEITEKLLSEVDSPLTTSIHAAMQSPLSPNNYTLNFIPNTERHHVENHFTSLPSLIYRTGCKDDATDVECGQEIQLKELLSQGTEKVEEYSLSSSVYLPSTSANSNQCPWSTNLQHSGGAFSIQSSSATEPPHHIEGYAEKDDNLLYKFMYPSETVREVEDDIYGSSSLVVNNSSNTVTDFQNDMTEKNLKGGSYSSEKTLIRKGKAEKYGNSVCDWAEFRKQVQSSCGKRERNIDTLDSLDYDAIRNSGVDVVAATIRERGMNNMLAERIKGFLDRIVAEHGDIDLEWLRDAPPDKAKDYLLSIRGLGLKSVECVRLLTLHHLAFPVDTNVGRIAVRLGWVPLQPLPESLQLHLLELYPVLESIQKYLWPRLCKLDQRTLYELHYQMITFGKVFCTKSRPNCNACPMRGECRHFASAFASARLSLPGPEDRSIISIPIPITDSRNSTFSNRMPLPLLEQGGSRVTISEVVNCEPIIEEPETPEPEVQEIIGADIEDAFCQDPEEIPTIRLNVKAFTTNLQSYMQENNIEFNEGGMSKALVTLDPAAASIPAPKLKNVSRLRTEHQVYELPDSHPLLQDMDRREPDDPSPYLLAIWTPGETADSIEGLEPSCGHLESGVTEDICLSCSSTREANSQTVRGTLLIPCRTATRGSFPLNGTYFQVNEVFADHDSSLNPIMVPRTWIWNLPRRTVYFGTSVSTIFKGLSTEGIQYCFWRGFLCVRGFDKNTRAPRPLMARLHLPASKLSKTNTVKK